MNLNFTLQSSRISTKIIQSESIISEIRIYIYLYLSYPCTMIDWKSSVIILLLAFTSFVYILNEDRDNFSFEIDSQTLKFHSNWTRSFDKLSHKKELENALQIKTLRNLDLSFAHSHFKADFMTQLLQTPFSSSLENVKLNVGSLPMETKDIEYLLSLVPNSVKSLQVHLDSISLSSGFGVSLAYQLNRFTLLRSLTISLLLSLPKHQQEMGIFFKLHKPREELKELSLILIGNNFEASHFQRFPEYLNKLNLTTLELNLYANKLGPEGAQLISEAIRTQPHLKNLQIDLYFNNIAENGTKSICEQVSKLENLESLALNFDFNYIKNEGGKQIGSMLAKVRNLKELEIGVATKNFGYLGFKSVIEGMRTQTGLRKLVLRCSVNRVGMNGALIVKDMLNDMPQLEQLNLGFVENYIGDEGITMLSQSISKLSSIKHLILNFGFNDARSYGLVNSLKAFSQNAYDYLFIGLSHNQFRDKDVQLVLELLPSLIQNNHQFDLDFVDTAVSKKVSNQIKTIFANTNDQFNKKSELSINSIIPDAEQNDQSQTNPTQVRQSQRKTELQIKKQKQLKQKLDLQNEQKKREKEERQLKKKQEQDRIENEKREKVRIENEKKEQERIEKEKREQERLENEKKEKERIEKEKKKQERIKSEKKEQERLENEKKQQERLEKAKKEQERIESEKKEQERLEKAKKEQERIESEKKEQERLEKAKKEQERLEKEKKEQERIESEKKEQERLQNKKKEQKRLEKAKKEQERIESEKKVQERIVDPIFLQDELKQLQGNYIDPEPVPAAKQRKQ